MPKNRVIILPPGGDHTDPLQMDYKVWIMSDDRVWYQTFDGEQTPYTKYGSRTFVKVDPGAELPAPTWIIPTDFAKPLLDELYKVLGQAPGNDAATLTQRLDIETARVDRVLGWLMDSTQPTTYRSAKAEAGTQGT